MTDRGGTGPAGRGGGLVQVLGRRPRWLVVVAAIWLVVGTGLIVALLVRSRSDSPTEVTGAALTSSEVGPDSETAGDSSDTATSSEVSGESGETSGAEQSNPESGGTGGIDDTEVPDDQSAAGESEHRGPWVDPASSGAPWSAFGAIDGLLTFRGNPTRSFYGRGPVPTAPEVKWTFDIGCSLSTVGGEDREWCGTGWTGQPLVFPAPGISNLIADGGGADEADSGTVDDWWLGVGGYNRAVNFVDPETGREVYPPFFTGDIIKGTATVDPDGYPLLYTGSRDDFLHVVALDRAEPTELWRLSAEAGGRTLWNNDWDGSPMVLDDFLIVGGENSRFYVVKLNRAFDPSGSVTVDPEMVASVEGWDEELLAELNDVQVSIENSVAVSGSVAYFANSGGLVQGWDLAPVADGRPPERVFRFWTGDDTDATVAVDAEGQLYVASEYERGSARSRELGQVFRLDPSNPDDPLVWSLEANNGLDSGVWATPALHRDLVIVAADDGRVLGIDRETGRLRWTLTLSEPLWSSPVVVDDTLIQGDCFNGLQAYDVSDTSRRPPQLWALTLDGCVESTPAVWDGWIYVGTRGGLLYGISDGGTG